MRRVVWYKLADVWDVLTASIIKVPYILSIFMTSFCFSTYLLASLYSRSQGI
jgi:hypothetical protein